MIKNVSLRCFKRFTNETFSLSDRVVLAGPNNSGKSTLLQSVSVWNLALQRWMTERSKSGSRAVARTGVPISRKDFAAIPLREMNLLWTDRDTAYSKEEKPGAKAGFPKPIEIVLSGAEGDGTEWDLSVHLRYANRELIYVNVTDAEGHPHSDPGRVAAALQIVHVPPFSGIGAEETRYDRGYQNLLIGQGKPGDILRNLLWEVYQKDETNRKEWKLLETDIEEIFGYELQEPRYSEADPYIQVEYFPQSKGRKPLDLATAGSGFHQVLTLLAFFYARPASVLLVDEPDAHEHVILQRQVYDRLRAVAGERRCQLIISTHSEVILEETAAEQILSFYGRPHRLDVKTGRERVREALRLLSSFDILQAEQGRNVLYLEDEGDLKILREFAKVIGHPMVAFLVNPFFLALHGRDARIAKNHFFSLRAIHDSVHGVLLLDGDNRQLDEHEITADGLTILRWHRYEIENYLVVPEALYRFTVGPEPSLFSDMIRQTGEAFLRSQLPPAAIADPIGDNEFLASVTASKSLLPDFFAKTNQEIPKKDYYLVASQLKPGEIHPEVVQKLDAMLQILIGSGPSDSDPVFDVGKPSM